MMIVGPLVLLQLVLFISLIWRYAIAWEIMPVINALSIILTLKASIIICSKYMGTLFK